MVADQRDAADAPVEPDRAEQVLYLLRIVADRPPRRQMPQREHRMGLTAAKVGLQIDHRGGVLIAGDPGDRSRDEVLQAAGEEGAAEKLDGVGVLRSISTSRSTTNRNNRNNWAWRAPAVGGRPKADERIPADDPGEPR
jgi:hypothetical protein